MKKRLEEAFLGLILILSMTIILISCSPAIEDINETNETNETEEKEAQYSQALIELSEDNSTNNTNLDKRYNHLQNQIDNILEGKQELKMATFTRIKIELDYLNTKRYDSNKVKLITNDFMKVFAEAEELAEAEKDDDPSSSLNDRYYSLNSKIEKISSGEQELKVVDYLQIEKDLNKLEEDEYIPSRISSLKTILFQAVLTELESAIIDYEIPEIVEEVPEEEVVEKEEVEVEEPKEEVVKVPKGPRTHIVEIIDGGFDTDTISVNVGDTIVWDNVRQGRYKIALVIGNGMCSKAKSKLFGRDKSFNATFNEPGKCWFSDGIFTTQAMQVVIS